MQAKEGDIHLLATRAGIGLPFRKTRVVHWPAKAGKSSLRWVYLVSELIWESSIPTKPGSYLAGVEGGRAAYQRSAVARDRDKTRQQVLEQLGWNILRLGPPDWWYDSDAATEALDLAWIWLGSGFGFGFGFGFGLGFGLAEFVVP